MFYLLASQILLINYTDNKLFAVHLCLHGIVNQHLAETRNKEQQLREDFLILSSQDRQCHNVNILDRQQMILILVLK